MQNSTNLKTLSWVAILALATVALSYNFACVTPFAALSTIAALTLPRKTGLLLVLVAWALNQAVGYIFLSYPADSFLWGIAIGAAAILSYFTALGIASKLKESKIAILSIASFISAFAVYQCALFLFSLVLGGSENFSLDIIAKLFSENTIAFAALLAANWLNSVTGVFPVSQARFFKEAR